MPNDQLDLRDRAASFASLEAETFDILVIGGGITGAGIARDAAMRGLRVALVEAQDFASGTSSRSSKMIHGGLRYLAQGDVTVVKEAAMERRTLRRIAPHLASTLPMIVPAKSKAGIAKFRTGLWTYEKLGQVSDDEKHEVWSAAELKKEEPHLITNNLAGAIVYPEYLTDDVRLTLANIRSAVAAGAVAVNYAAVKSIIVENGKAIGAEVKETLGSSEQGARVKARVVVNAAGPWVDAIRKLEQPDVKSRLQLTKGIHVVFSRERLKTNRTVVLTTPDKRSIFSCPHGDCAYLGTTDTFYPETDYWPKITREDIDYLIDTANNAFDFGPLNYRDVTAMWSGLRPLLSQEGKAPSEISRKDEILTGVAGILSVAGGKLTAYRLMAERLVSACEKQLGRKPSLCETAEQLLPGGDFEGGFDAKQAEIQAQGVSASEAERIVRFYGGEAGHILAAGGDIAAEAERAVTHEGALTLEDYWNRRSGRARFDPDAGMDALKPAAAKMAELLGWSDSDKEKQITHCQDIHKAKMMALG